MSRWLLNATNKFIYRNRNFNSIVSVTPYGIDDMADSFNTIFENLTSYKDEISSLRLYPFFIKYPENTPTGMSGNVLTVLETTRGKDLDIHAVNIDPKASLMNIGYIWIPNVNYNFLDYNGYTKYSVLLPYFSIVDLDASIFVGKYLVIRLAIDFFSGQGMYILSVSENEPTYIRDSIYYNDGDEVNEIFITNYIFELGIDIPLGESNVGDIKRNALLGTIKGAVSIGAMAYGMSLPPSTSTTTFEDVSVASSRGDYKGARMIPRSMTESSGTKITTHNTPKNKITPIAETVYSGVSILNNNFIQGHGDRTNSPMSMWNYQTTPRLFIYLPIVDKVDDNYKHLKGQPLGLNCRLNQISGFTKISNIHLDGFSGATLEELSRIENIIAEGIILPKEETITFTVQGHEYSCPRGFTWEMFIKTQGRGFKLAEASGSLIKYRYSTSKNWVTLNVELNDVIESGVDYT